MFLRFVFALFFRTSKAVRTSKETAAVPSRRPTSTGGLGEKERAEGRGSTEAKKEQRNLRVITMQMVQQV